MAHLRAKLSLNFLFALAAAVTASILGRASITLWLAKRRPRALLFRRLNRPSGFAKQIDCFHELCQLQLISPRLIRRRIIGKTTRDSFSKSAKRIRKIRRRFTVLLQKIEGMRGGSWSPSKSASEMSALPPKTGILIFNINVC
jgi:hypothetical protein